MSACITIQVSVQRRTKASLVDYANESELFAGQSTVLLQDGSELNLIHRKYLGVMFWLQSFKIQMKPKSREIVIYFCSS